MIWWVIVLEAIVFAGIFTAIVLPSGLSDKKYSPSSIHNYPPDIQEEYFKTHERIDVSSTSKKVIFTKSLGVTIFCVILFVSALLAGAHTFLQGFLLSFGLMIWIGLYDTLFIDWVLFANIKAFRLEGTEHMDRAYHQKWFHLKGILFPGVVFGTIPALIVGLLIALIR
jgi:hypothetical protein